MTWLVAYREVPNRRRRRHVIAVPHAGGWASSFKPWRTSVGDSTHFSVASLPGRGIRAEEPSATSMEAIVEPLAEDLLAQPDVPITVVGHSFGSIVAYELARKLEACGRPPELLVVSGRQPPCFPSVPPFAFRSDDEQLVGRLVDMGGMDAKLRHRMDVARKFLPAIRADLELLETHRRPLAPTEVNITAVHAEDDPVVDGRRLCLWSLETVGAFRQVSIPGGHFALYESQYVTRLLRSQWAHQGERDAYDPERGERWPGQSSLQ